MRPANGRPSADYIDDVDLDPDYKGSDLPDVAAWEAEQSGTLNLSMGVNRELVNLSKQHIFVIRSKTSASSSGAKADAGEVAKCTFSGGSSASGPPKKTGFSIEEIMRR